MAERREHEGFLETALGRAHRTNSQERSTEADSTISYTEEVDSGRTFAISPQITTLLGYTQEEWMGDADLWIDRIHPKDRDRVVEGCERANRAREPYRCEYRIIANDGRIVRVRDEAVLIGGAAGQPLCWQGAMTVIASEPSPDEPILDAANPSR